LLRPCRIAPSHARTARALGPHGAAAYASESVLRATVCSGPFASVRSCSCARMPTPPASVPCLLRPPNTCTHRQLPRVTARTLVPLARHRPRSCRSSAYTGSPARELQHRLSHATPTPVLLRYRLNPPLGSHVRARACSLLPARATADLSPSFCSCALRACSAPAIIRAPAPAHAPEPCSARRQLVRARLRLTRALPRTGSLLESPAARAGHHPAHSARLLNPLQLLCRQLMHAAKPSSCARRAPASSAARRATHSHVPLLRQPRASNPLAALSRGRTCRSPPGPHAAPPCSARALRARLEPRCAPKPPPACAAQGCCCLYRVEGRKGEREGGGG
jgi:hypothetical protein